MPSLAQLSAKLDPVRLLQRSGALSVVPDALARTAGAMHLARVTVAREPAPVAPSPADVVAGIGAARLLRYRRHRDAPAGVVKAPILLCPSLINRLYVLDLKEGISVVEQLLMAGHPVYGIDWGNPGDAEHGVDFEGFTRRLASFLATACDDAHVEQMTVLGHCLGGTMAVALAATDPRHLRSLVLLTAPLRFHDGGLLSAWSRAPFIDPSDLTHLVGHVPAWITQPTFSILKPMGQASKALRLWQSLGDPRFLEFFRCLETWINDNVAIPDAFFEDLIDQLYRRDALDRGTFRFSTGPVVLEDVEVPVLSIAASQDHIVPPASAVEPAQRFSSTVNRAEVLDGGHIGVVVGGQARKRLWPLLLSWLDEHGVASKTAPASTAA
jgi:polyhydroxyalkanoate synthase subunit PhaC